MKILSVCVLLILSSVKSFSQGAALETAQVKQSPSSLAKSIEIMSNLESDLIEINELIEKHFRQALYLTDKLAKQDLTLSSPRDQMDPRLAQEIETFENTKLFILDAIQHYRRIIDELPLTSDPQVRDNAKALYNQALIKSILPRFDLAEQDGVLSKLIGFREPRYVEALIPREVALELIYTDFEQHNSSRILELIGVYNKIVNTINSNRNSKILVTYSKSIASESEARVYFSMIKGEEVLSLPAVCAKLF